MERLASQRHPDAGGRVAEPAHVPFFPFRAHPCRADRHGGTNEEKALAIGEHLVTSGAFGAGYGALHAALDLRVLPSGPLYGLMVYAVMLGGVGPALGVTARPWNEAPMTVGRRLMMHAAYGAVTALVAEQVRHKLI